MYDRRGDMEGRDMSGYTSEWPKQTFCIKWIPRPRNVYFDIFWGGVHCTPPNIYLWRVGESKSNEARAPPPHSAPRSRRSRSAFRWDELQDWRPALDGPWGLALKGSPGKPNNINLRVPCIHSDVGDGLLLVLWNYYAGCQKTRETWLIPIKHQSNHHCSDVMYFCNFLSSEASGIEPLNLLASHAQIVAIVTGVISQLVVVIMVIDIIKLIPTAPPIFIYWIANPTTYRWTNHSSVYNPFIPKYAMNKVIKCFFLMPRCPRCPVPASQDSDPVLYSPSFVWVSKVLNHLQFLGRTSTMKSTPMCKIIKSWSTGKPLAWKRSPTEISTPISQDLYCSSHVKNAPLISPMISPFRRSRVPQLKKTLPIWKMPCKKLKILCWWT